MDLSQLSDIMKNFLHRYDLASNWMVMTEEANDRILIQRRFPPARPQSAAVVDVKSHPAIFPPVTVGEAFVAPLGRDQVAGPAGSRDDRIQAPKMAQEIFLTQHPSISPCHDGRSSFLSCIAIGGDDDQRRFSCKLCGAAYPTARECNHHVDQSHGVQAAAAEPRFECSKCGEVFTTRPALSSHEEKRHGPRTAKRKCFVCGETLEAALLNQHLQSVHPGALPNEAEHAGARLGLLPSSSQGPSHGALKRRSASKGRKNDVDAEIDDRRKTVLCDYEGCAKRFTTVYNKKHHIESVHLGIKHPCHLCSSAFAQERDRKVHIKAVHFGFKVKCEVCGKEFNRPSEMRRHLKQMHGQSPG